MNEKDKWAISHGGALWDACEGEGQADVTGHSAAADSASWDGEGQADVTGHSAAADSASGEARGGKES